MVAFKTFRRFNDPALRPLAGVRARIDGRAPEYFGSESLPDKLVCALGRRKALPIKEIFESFEFFARVRRRLRAPHVADLCCGHGLTGALFAVFEGDTVERVTLLDKRRPDNHDQVLEALKEVAPWAVGRLEFVQAPVSRAGSILSQGASVVGVHACGARTDRCLDVALEKGGAVAVMPCCYFKTTPAAPRAVRSALGAEIATDVHRTYRLEAAGYTVQWSAIPEEISSMNRIIVGVKGR